MARSMQLSHWPQSRQSRLSGITRLLFLLDFRPRLGPALGFGRQRVRPPHLPVSAVESDPVTPVAVRETELARLLAPDDFAFAPERLSHETPGGVPSRLLRQTGGLPDRFVHGLPPIS